MDAVRKLVSERLKVQAAGPHPDPELLAAFAERSLRRDERDHLLDHVAACSDCREALYLAQTDESAQQVFSVRKQSRFALRWATLAASLIIVAGVVITNRSVITEHHTTSTAAAPDTASSNEISPKESSGPQSVATEAYAKVRPQEKHMTARPQANLQFDQSGEVHFAAAPALTANADAGSTASAINSANSVWRLENGDVLRALDSNWQTIPVGKGEKFHAISSIGSDVWVGGIAGALYHSSDSGQHWTKIEPAITGHKLDTDITQITFSDSSKGVISTANGEVWSTSDGGRSWRLK